MFKSKYLVLLFIAVFPLTTVGQEKFEKLTFKSTDGLQVTADLYHHHDSNAPFIVLCHQAGWSRGEYREIAPKLIEMGFNCMAIDQRSGKGINDVANQTFINAEKLKLETGFVDAEADMIEAIKFARTRYAKGKIILWGSSYSSALTLRIAGENPELVDGILSFAPGEYFGRFGKPGDWIQSSAKKIKVPTFITSSKNEAGGWKGIYDAIPGNSKRKFIPKTSGNHGSRALWAKFDDNQDYWKEVTAFLGQFRSKDGVVKASEFKFDLAHLRSSQPALKGQWESLRKARSENQVKLSNLQKSKTELMDQTNQYSEQLEKLESLQKQAEASPQKEAVVNSKSVSLERLGETLATMKDRQEAVGRQLKSIDGKISVCEWFNEGASSRMEILKNLLGKLEQVDALETKQKSMKNPQPLEKVNPTMIQEIKQLAKELHRLEASTKAEAEMRMKK